MTYRRYRASDHGTWRPGACSTSKLALEAILAFVGAVVVVLLVILVGPGGESSIPPNGLFRAHPSDEQLIDNYWQHRTDAMVQAY